MFQGQFDFLIKEQQLLFVGSKERLKRNIAKQEGAILENSCFTLIWRSSYFRRGLAFRIKGSYEKTEKGYLLHYRFLPTIATILWVSVPVLIFLGFGVTFFFDADVDAGIAISLFSLLYPAIALWQAASCHKRFRRFFEVSTR